MQNSNLKSALKNKIERVRDENSSKTLKSKKKGFCIVMWL